MARRKEKRLCFFSLLHLEKSQINSKGSTIRIISLRGRSSLSLVVLWRDLPLPFPSLSPAFFCWFGGTNAFEKEKQQTDRTAWSGRWFFCPFYFFPSGWVGAVAQAIGPTEETSSSGHASGVLFSLFSRLLSSLSLLSSFAPPVLAFLLSSPSPTPSFLSSIASPLSHSFSHQHPFIHPLPTSHLPSPLIHHIICRLLLSLVLLSSLQSFLYRYIPCSLAISLLSSVLPSVLISK